MALKDCFSKYAEGLKACGGQMQGSSTLGSDTAGPSFVDPYCFLDLEADLIACLSQGFEIDWMEAFTYARAARSSLGVAGFDAVLVDADAAEEQVAAT